MTKAKASAKPPLAPPPACPLDLGRESRHAARTTLLIRSAKLICQSGEYLCLLRDVSSGGVRLRLFHALPPEAHFFLAMANGEIFPIEKRWSQPDPAGERQAGACQAGFRFIQPIDVDGFIEEASPYPRRPIRLHLECHGRLFSEGRCSPAIVHDLSQGGARIETTTWLALHQTVRLVVDGLPARFAQVRWRNRYDHGLAFDQAFRLDELAVHAKILQPFAAQPLPATTEPARRLPVQASA